jgi:tellurite resistance protein TerC
MAFTAGYLIERALSIDNLFVFLLIFTYFEVPKVHQYKVLFWGIFVALLMRAFFIVTGIALVERFEWIIYVFGAFLIYTGIKIALGKDAKVSPERNPVVKIARKIIPATDHYVEGNFFTRIGGKIFATPLFIVLIAVEMTDLVFAVDSIPAVLAISLDPFVVYTSNIFAILGLRALYFALAACAQMFHYLTYGITSILIFVGAKMLVSDFISIPVGIALGVIGLILIASVVASILRPARQSPSETGANLAEE